MAVLPTVRMMGTDLNVTNEGGGAIFLYDQSIATITGTAPNFVLNLVIPRGATGAAAP